MINELIDVYAAEVLRGPQGTLFGKNTASGAINIRTVAPDPDTPNAFVELTAGDLGLQRISAAGNIRLSDNAALRATVFSSQRDGYVDNYTYDFGAPFIGVEKDVFNDRNRWGARVQLAYDNDDDFNLRLILDYAEIDEVCCAGISRVDALFAQDALTRGIVAFGSDAARSLDPSQTPLTRPILDHCLRPSSRAFVSKTMSRPRIFCRPRKMRTRVFHSR
jgi:outer membrane receptor protein involved in Fe transport